jgi:DNA replication protein DnaC
MTPQATLEKMQRMKFFGMANAWQATMHTGFSHQFTPDELLAHLVDAEWDERYNRRLARLLKTANFRNQASLEQIQFDPVRKLDKNLLLRLSTCDWITKGENVLITGATGVGKSFLACALGRQACIQGLRVIYFSSIKLFSELKLAKADGTYAKELKRIQRHNLVVIDDFGLHPVDEQSKLILLEILEDRYGEASMIITSQFPTSTWHDILANPTIADAICDRLLHRAYQFELQGESMRRKSETNSG